MVDMFESTSTVIAHAQPDYELMHNPIMKPEQVFFLVTLAL